jgi:hypothetical protein
MLVPSSGESHSGGRTMIRLSSVKRAFLRAKVFFAANVIPWNELRGVNRGDQELSRVNKVTPLLAHEKVELSPVNSSRESHGHQELSRVNKVQRERGALYALGMVRRRISLSIRLL